MVTVVLWSKMLAFDSKVHGTPIATLFDTVHAGPLYPSTQPTMNLRKYTLVYIIFVGQLPVQASADVS